MRNVIGLFVLMAIFNCSESGNRNGVEILESWENGVVKKDRVNLAADTFIVNHYHDNYKLHMTGNVYYVDGVEVKHGEWRVLYPDGKNWSLNNFDKGVENGEYKTWYKNGKLNIWGYYSSGSATGNWTFYDTSGVVVKTFDATPRN
ncbi:MAG: hypothetical protein CL847_03285 [Crocinitomicaceae bacterium]|nr:hypothetical protein [Crocinitomicaceae bacterium]|tara:strand:+ start:10257 stop:10694 length:438 start_codon:yes stop_codon:yes gene_type:complete